MHQFEIKIIIGFRPQDNNEDMDKEMGAEFGHENEKTSSQSSPTPSEMSRDCLDSANDGKY